MKNLLVILLTLFTFNSAQAITHVFMGSVDRYWHNPANWNTGLVPNSSDIAFISVGAEAVIPNGYTAECDLLTISNGKQLIINDGGVLDADLIHVRNGLLNNNGEIAVRTLTIGSNNNNIGELTNSYTGRIQFKNALNAAIYIHQGQLTNNGEIISEYDTGAYTFIKVFINGLLTNNGIIEKKGLGKEYIFNEGEFVNGASGEIILRKTNAPGSTQSPVITNKKLFKNRGEISIQKDGSMEYLMGIQLMDGSDFINEQGGYVSIIDAQNNPLFIRQDAIFHNHGTIRILQSSVYKRMVRGVNANSCFFYNYTGGIVIGDGSLTRVKFESLDGFIKPSSDGHLYGKITLEKEFWFINGLTYDCQIGGYASGGLPGGNDLIHMGETADLDYGFLDVSLTGGFTPVLGDEFVIFSARNPIDGTFDSVNLPALPSGMAWALVYETDQVVLNVIPDSSPLQGDNGPDLADIQLSSNEQGSEANFFPNPFNSCIKIETPGSGFEIFDTQGRSVYRSQTPSEEVDLSKYAEGFYFVKYQIDDEVITEIIVKSKQ